MTIRTAKRDRSRNSSLWRPAELSGWPDCQRGFCAFRWRAIHLQPPQSNL